MARRKTDFAESGLQAMPLRAWKTICAAFWLFFRHFHITSYVYHSVIWAYINENMCSVYLRKTVFHTLHNNNVLCSRCEALQRFETISHVRNIFHTVSSLLKCQGVVNSILDNIKHLIEYPRVLLFQNFTPIFVRF